VDPESSMSHCPSSDYCVIAGVLVPIYLSLPGLVRIMGPPKRAGRTDGRVGENARESGAGIPNKGYTIGGSTFDALIFGHYEGMSLLYRAAPAAGSHHDFARIL